MPEAQAKTITKTDYMEYVKGRENFRKYATGKQHNSYDKRTTERGQALHREYEAMPKRLEFDGESINPDIENFPESIRSDDFVQENNCLETLIQWKVDMFNKMKEKGLDLERYFIPETEKRFVYHEEIDIKGDIDGVYPAPFGEGFVLFDLKTQFYADHKREMEFYTLLVEKATGKPVQRAVVLSLVADKGENNPRNWSRDELDTDRVKEEVKEMREWIEDQHDIPNNWTNSRYGK